MSDARMAFLLRSSRFLLTDAGVARSIGCALSLLATALDPFKVQRRTGYCLRPPTFPFALDSSFLCSLSFVELQQKMDLNPARFRTSEKCSDRI